MTPFLNILIISLKNKSFYKPIDWLGFIFTCISHHGWEQNSDFQCSDYWKMHLWNYSSLLHDLIIRPHVKQPSINFPKKIVPHAKLFEEKSPPYFGGGRRHYFIFISFPISKSFTLKLGGTNYGLSSKNYQVTVFLKLYRMVMKFSELY